MKKKIMEMELGMASRALAHYIFRNGPVEDMHADGKLSDEDMKTLNIYMNDRIATFMHLLKTEDWSRLGYLLYSNGMLYGRDWNAPVLQLEELDEERSAVSKYLAKE